jgi:hypothetical protein
MFQRAKPGVQQLLIAQHNRLSITGDILWTPIEIKSSNSLLNPARRCCRRRTTGPVSVSDASDWHGSTENGHHAGFERRTAMSERVVSKIFDDLRLPRLCQ